MLPLQKKKTEAFPLHWAVRKVYFKVTNANSSVLKKKKELSTMSRELCKYPALNKDDWEMLVHLIYSWLVGPGENWPSEQSSRGITGNVFSLLAAPEDKVAVMKGKWWKHAKRGADATPFFLTFLHCWIFWDKSGAVKFFFLLFFGEFGSLSAHK